MARSAILHLLAAFLCWHTQGVLGRDGDGQEYFPLSGGVSDGVKVTIKADKVVNSGRLDFLTPARKIALRWDMNVNSQMVSRNSQLDANWGEAETFGGWGLDANAAIVLEFYKTKSKWQVSVGSAGAAPIRFPWFDFAYRGAELMTHVSVYDGFENVEVVQSRPVCTKVCHITECGAGGCAGENTTCYSTNEDMCDAATDTGFATGMSGLSCCDGMPKGIPIANANRDMWVVLADDQDFLNRACGAYGSESKSCGDFAGKKGKIEYAMPMNGTYAVWVPSAVTQAHNYDEEVSTFILPALALQLSTGASREFVRLPDAKAIFADAGFTVDPHNSLIYESTAASVTAGLHKGMFINMIAYSLGGTAGWRWSDYSIFDRDYLTTFATDADLLITDEKTEEPECLGDLPFEDPNGLTCHNYTVSSFCTSNGEPSTEWCDTYGTQTGNSQCTFYGGGLDPLRNLYPAWQCCACGGGNISAPVEAPPPPMRFIM